MQQKQKNHQRNNMPAEQIEDQLYGGKVVVKHNPKSTQQRYSVFVDGEKVSANSVSTIVGIKDKSIALQVYAVEKMRDWLLPLIDRGITEEDVLEAATKYTEFKEAAAGLGEKIHQWCEEYILNKLGKGPLPDMPDEKAVEIGVNAFLDWEHQHKVRYHSTERILYSLQNGFVGRMDIDATIDGRRCVLDLKTSNGLYNGVRMQTAGYACAANEELAYRIAQIPGAESPKGDIITGRWALRLAKETEEEYFDRMFLKKKFKNPQMADETPEQHRARVKELCDPYMVFEVIDLDADPKVDTLADDYAAFLAAQVLFKWDARTDFWKLKNAKA